MPPCKNDPTKKYKGTEPSPKGIGWCAHAEKEGKVRKGKDGNQWIVKKVSNGSKRWMKKGVSKNNKLINLKPNCNKFVIYNKSKKSNFEKRWGITVTADKIMGLQSKDKGYIHKWISYNNFEDNPTKIPNGFSLNNHKINKEWLNEFKCGTKIPITKSNVSKIKHNGYKKYMIHDNGGRPFLVYVNSKNIYIYKIDEDYIIDPEYDYKNPLNNSWMYTIMVKEYKNVKKVYIGKSILNKSTKFSDGHGKKYDGNTILVQLSNNKYVYIGEYIKEFKLDDEIVKYYSTVGNNDVPYPIILGKKNVYFMLDFKYVDRKLFPDNMNDIEWSDCYSYFYGQNGSALEKYAKSIKNIKLIHKRLW
jgi:hypothetical protein